MSDIFQDQRRRDSERAERRSASFDSIRKTKSIFDRYSKSRSEAGRPQTVVAWERVVAATILLLLLVGGVVLGIVKASQSPWGRRGLAAVVAIAILALTILWIRRRRGRGRSPAGKDAP